MAISKSASTSSRCTHPDNPFHVLERKLAVRFRNLNLLKTALTHSSYLNESPDENLECNERLEFLGDAILGSVIAEELYTRFPDEQEGVLTSMRSSIVRGDTLANASNRIGIGEHLLMGSGEEKSGGRKRNSNLEAAFEATVGAIFIEGDYQAARAFCVRVLSDEIASANDSAYPKNPKSALQELVQSKHLEAPKYRIIGASGEPHAPTFTAEVIVDGAALGTGNGRSKSIAEQEAAKAALECLTQKTN